MNPENQPESKPEPVSEITKLLIPELPNHRIANMSPLFRWVLIIIVFVGGFLVYYHWDAILSTLAGKAGTSQAGKWEGSWNRQGSTNFDYATLEISDATDDSFNFSIESFTGNIGQIGGYVGDDEQEDIRTAVVTGDTARFISEPDEADSDGVPCRLTFTLSGDTIEIEENSGCTYFAGNATYFSGTFERDGEILQKTMKNTELFSDNEAEYQAFASVVGSDIELFDSTVGTEDSEYDKAQGVTVGEFFMPHNATTKSIVIVGKGNVIWAAVSDWSDTEGDMVIRYYTNAIEWKNKVPPAISEWNTDNKKVLYMSGKDKK